jgi:hypothetical protein
MIYFILKKEFINNVYKKDIKLIEYIKEYCNILDYDFNTISSWKLEIPDDFRKYR